MGKREVGNRRIATGAEVQPASRHVSWSYLRARTESGPPSLVALAGKPHAELVIEPGGSRIGLRMQCAVRQVPPSPLADVDVRLGADRGMAYVEVSTSNRDIYQEFYGFCCSLSDRVQLGGQSVQEALSDTLRQWAGVIRTKSLMSEERQAGLVGELIYLSRLADRTGWIKAVAAWHGPEAEEHDFTLADRDIEVKTTRAEKRVHVIGSLTQMRPKGDRPLLVVSVQLTVAGGDGAVTLPGIIERIRSQVRRSGAASRKRLEALLDRQTWKDADAQLYDTSYQLRSPLLVIPVDKDFPAIVPATLAPMGALLSRIERLNYSVNVEGLGRLEGSRGFNPMAFGK